MKLPFDTADVLIFRERQHIVESNVVMPKPMWTRHARTTQTQKLVAEALQDGSIQPSALSSTGPYPRGRSIPSCWKVHFSPNVLSYIALKRHPENNGWTLPLSFTEATDRNTLWNG